MGLCWNGGVLETLRGLDIRIPDDLSVAGFLNPLWYRIASPPLTTYELPLREMGDMAARLLLQRIGDTGDTGDGRRNAPRAVRFEGRLIVRESTGAPRSRPVLPVPPPDRAGATSQAATTNAAG